MANIAEQCRNLNVFFGGVGWAGRIDSFTPPTIESTVEDYRAGGMDGAIPLRMGQEPMETEIVFNGYHKEVIESWGLEDANALQTIVRGALVDYNGVSKGLVFTMGGPVTQLESDEIRGQGEVPKMTIMQRLHYYKVEIDKVASLEIDLVNMEKIIGGVDHLAPIRGLLGL